MFVYPTSKGSRLIVVFCRARRPLPPVATRDPAFQSFPASFQTPLANLNASLQGDGHTRRSVIDITFAFGVFGGSVSMFVVSSFGSVKRESTLRGGNEF